MTSFCSAGQEAGLTRLDGTMRYARRDAGPFAVDDVELEYTAESLGLLVVDVRSGGLERTTGRSSDAAGAGDVLLSAVPATAWEGRSCDLDVRVVRLDPPVLHQIVPVVPGDPGRCGSRATARPARAPPSTGSAPSAT